MFKVVSLSAAARIVQAALAFVTVLALAAVMPVDQFGVYMVAISVATIAQYIVSGWLAAAILREPIGTVTRSDIEVLAVGILIISAVAGVVSGAAALGAGMVLAVEASFQLTANLMATREKWSRLSLMYLARGAMVLLLVLMAAYEFARAGPVLIAYSISVASSIAFCREYGVAGGGVDLKRVVSCFRNYFPLSINSIIRQAYDRGDRVVIGALFGAPAAGAYALAADVVRRPIQTLGGAIQSVILPKLSRSLDKGEDISRVWEINGLVILWMCVIASIASVIGLDMIFLRLMPGKYGEELLYLGAAASVSATIEAMDTYHASAWVVASRQAGKMPKVYIAAALVFAMFCMAAWHFQSLWIVLSGVVAANFIGFTGILILSRRTRKVQFSTLWSVAAILVMAAALSGWLLLRPSSLWPI